MSKLIAQSADFISAVTAGHGHKTISILIDGELFKFTTSAIYITDMLHDDDDDVVIEGKQSLIDIGLLEHKYIKSDNFKYYI